MDRKFLRTALLQSLLISQISFLLPSGPAIAASGEPYSDEWIRGRISGAFAYNTSLDSTNLDVTSNGGNVTLVGSVPSLVERDFAEAVARATDGVKSVKNEIVVDESLALRSRSSFGQKVHDATITAAVKSKLIANRDTEGFSINVDTAANAVTLSGTLNSEKARLAAEQIAKNTSGVRSVANRLTVQPLDTQPAEARARLEGPSRSMGGAISDAWITTKVKTVLAFDSSARGSDISVKSRNGAVTLEGFAENPAQKAQIADQVRQVKGVRSVDNRLAVGIP